MTVDNVGAPEPVTAEIPCEYVTVREQGAAATTDYLVRAPSDADPPFRKASGEATVFRSGPGKLFQRNEIVGYVETVTGSVTFSKICE